MKSVEIVTSDSLEETLSCDDLFLEYFNAFLSLPAFPQKLCYSRFTGTFHDLDKEKVPVEPIRHTSIQKEQEDPFNNPDFSKQNSGVGSKISVYAAKEDERERVVRWGKEKRLPLFQDTQMYRELKLCKLLLRPLDLRRGSSRIRGYSRLSMGFATTTSIISGTGRNESPSRVLTSLDNQSTEDWTEIISTKYTETVDSRPTSRAFSLPPNLGMGRTWSATAMYDTSATDTSSATGDDATARHLKRPRTHRRRYPITSPASRRQDQSETSRLNLYSDSGLGTTGLGYAQSVGTSVKTRNIATRADTLGLGSRWESEEGYSIRTKTAMTSSSLPTDGFLTPGSPSAWMISKSKYEGKSALRTADSPSKPHRATIVLPKSKTQAPTVRVVPGSTTENGTTSSSSKPAKDQIDDDATFEYETNDVIDDDDEFDDDVGEFLDFDDRESSCEETETEIASIEKVHSMSMQHIKERIFRTKSGMDSFLKFIKGTSGEDLVEFWFDTEAFKDSIAEYEKKGLVTSSSSSGGNDDDVETENSIRLKRHRLFRNILDRHKFLLTDEAREQIRVSQAEEGLSYHVFSRTQYDVLRRLRSYWLPRFVIHKDAQSMFKQNLATGIWDDEDAFAYNPPVPKKTISCLPLLSIGYVNLPETTSVEETKLSVQTLESATAQVVAASPSRPTTSQIRMMSARSASLHTVMRALLAESEAGFPLRQYIQTHEDRSVLNSYDFLMCLEYLTEWSSNNLQAQNTNQKHGAVALGSSEAYSIFNTFLLKESPFYVKLPRKLSTVSLQQTLRKAVAPGAKQPSTVSSTIFRHVRQYALSLLSVSLRKYQHYEVDIYLEAREGKKRVSTPPAAKKPQPPSSTTTRKSDESSTTASEATTTFSKPWFTDDDSTETDSASTMYSYDVERIRQLASAIRQKGAKKPQRHVSKKPAQSKKLLKRNKTAMRSHQASKVQFTLPGTEDGGDSNQVVEGETEEEEEEEEASEDARKKRKKKKKAFLNQHPNRMTFMEIKENKLLYTFLKKYVSQCESVEIQNVMQMYQLCDALMGIPSSQVERKNIISSELVRTFLHPTGPKQIAMPNERTAQFFLELPNPTDSSVQMLQEYVIPSLDQAAANFSLGFGTLLKEYKLTVRSDLGQHMNKAELALRTLTLKPSSKRRKALGKHSARQAPTSEHKIMFMEALESAQEGSLPIELVHFYKYLQGFGIQEGFPLIHNDLMFYVEVSKFIASFHEDYDLVTLKRKIISIRDCFIDSQMDKTLQIDIKTGTAERLRRAMDSFVSDKGRDPHVHTLFDDAQHTVFNELLPFWAGFVTAMTPSEREGKRPVLKSERLQKRRLEAFLKTKDPKTEYHLPENQPKFDMTGIEFNFTVNSGIQWKAWSEASSSRSSTPPVTGLIEIVKAPPIGQRRIVRRSGFTIRKLQSSKDASAFPKPSFEKRKNATGTKTVTKVKTRNAAAKEVTIKEVSSNMKYATSVS